MPIKTPNAIFMFWLHFSSEIVMETILSYSLLTFWGLQIETTVTSFPQRIRSTVKILELNFLTSDRPTNFTSSRFIINPTPPFIYAIPI